jgi:hypothetical protein
VLLNRNYILNVEVLKALNVMRMVFWVVVPCGLVGNYQLPGGTYHFNPEDEGNTFLQNGTHL